MASRAVVTRYADEVANPQTGEFEISAYFIVQDLARAVDKGRVLVASGIVLSGAPATWSATIEAAVIAWAALPENGGFNDLTSATLFIPTIA